MEKKLLNAILQIDESEHLDKERMIIRYQEDPDDPKSFIINIEDLSEDEIEVYDRFRQMIENLNFGTV